MTASREDSALQRILYEYKEASNKHDGFHSFHEAYAVLLEEVDEMWEAIKGNFPLRFIQREATQVAAMALAILLDFSNERT